MPSCLSISIQISAALSFHSYFSAFFPFIPLFPEINPEYKVWPVFFYKLCTDLTQYVFFPNPSQASGHYDVHKFKSNLYNFEKTQII